MKKIIYSTCILIFGLFVYIFTFDHQVDLIFNISTAKNSNIKFYIDDEFQSEFVCFINMIPVDRFNRLYPVPVENSMAVEVNNIEINGMYQVNKYDAFDKNCLSQEMNMEANRNCKFHIDVSDFPPGTYFMKIVSSNKTRSGIMKFIMI